MHSVTIDILPKQERFIFAHNRLAIYRGGVRSGKTVALSHWGIKRALKGRTVVLVEPTYGMCRDVLLRKLKDTLTSYGLSENRNYTVRYTAPLEITFKGTPGRIILRSAESPLIGFDAHDGGLDEFCFVRQETYLELLQRLSEASDAQVRLTSSPVYNSWAKELEDDKETLVLQQSLLENSFLPLAYIESLKKSLGEGSKYYRQQVLGEYVSMDDGIMDVTKFHIVPKAPLFGKALVRAWDFASSSKTTADYTASVLMSAENGRYVIHDVQRLHGPFASIQSQIVQAMLSDPPGTLQLCESNGPGLVVISVLRSLAALQHVPIVPVLASTDKVSRALPLSGAIAAGSVSVTDDPWNKDFLSEFESFGPKAKHDDQVDAAAHAYNHLSRPAAQLCDFNF